MADEQIFEEIAAVAQLFDRDPQFMTLSGIEFAQLPRFFPCLLGSARKNLRGKPFDGTALTAPMLGPVAVLKPLQRVEEKRTITRRIDCGFRPIEGAGASRGERVGQFLHPRFARQDAAQRFDLAFFVDIEVTRRGEFSRQPFELGLDLLALLVAQNTS